MPSEISVAEVRRIATLARLELTNAECSQFAAQLGEILGYVEQLNAIDTKDVAPTAHAIDLVNVLRDDAPATPLEQSAALKNAPRREAGHFALPKVLDQP